LFPVRTGKAISDARIQKVIKQYAQAAGITAHVSPHVLRHSFATEMYSRSVPHSAIQSMLGHESKTETAIYIHIPAHFKKQALTRIAISEGGAPCQ
jgi:site-specific recombinase XerD